MIRQLLPYFIFVLAAFKGAAQVPVQELNNAVKKAKPGDTIVVANGSYNNVPLIISANGKQGSPIVIKAQTPGGVILTGNSFLKITGDYIEVNGFHFTNGYAHQDAVIEFRENNNNLANNCRVTQCAIDNYSRPERFNTDSWIVMWGKNNRIDHCTIGDKLNGGTTLIVNLDDERSQENYHSIDSNYFNGRSRLGSNGGEMIRVGVSRYSLTASRTNIHHNFFDKCNGEVEIISIKSGENTVSRNMFYECEGGLVLRHGANNTVEGNIFIGNNKPYTGGIRVINPGHKVYNNLLIGLAGNRFRSAFSVLNGVPNSALNRYFQVKNVDIHHNTFINSSNIVFGAGKDAERTAAPEDVHFHHNFILSSSAELYKNANKDGGMILSDNLYSGNAGPAPGFKQAKSSSYLDKTIRGNKLHIPIITEAGASVRSLDWIEDVTGASWMEMVDSTRSEPNIYILKAKDSKSLAKIVTQAKDGDIIQLADDGIYEVNEPIIINKEIIIRSVNEKSIPELVSIAEKSLPAFFIIENKGILLAEGIRFNSAYKSFGEVQSAISTTTKPMNQHYALQVNNCSFYNFNESGYACIRATKSTYADAVIIRNCVFRNNSGVAIDFSAEKDDKGIYNVEDLVVSNCVFANNLGSAINVYRGGNDESTTGPTVLIDHCTFNEVDNKEQGCVVKLIGVQTASVTNCIFNKSGAGGRSIWFEEMSWDDLTVDYCNFFQSGRVGSFHNKVLGKHVYKIDPQFINAGGYNFNLKTSSPLLNKDSKAKPLGAKL